MTLHAHVILDRKDFHLDVELSVAPEELVAIIGPNGAGKSTFIEAIAGRLRPTAGLITLNGEQLFAAPSKSTDSKHLVFIPPEARKIGWLSQQPLLFPHLSVLENVAFGPRARGVDRSAARVDALNRLERVGLSQFADRRPHQLSGGQQQRVAITRTLAVKPAALLLDEPFAALDIDTAASIRELVATECAQLKIPTLMVTHDPLDATVLADRVVELRSGRLISNP